jgi:hypothetical protein
MTIGPLVVAAGLVMLSRVQPGVRYVTGILPAALVFGLGLAMTVAPLTAAVLAAVDDAHVGVGSAVNNAVARLAGLLSVAVLPALVNLQTSPASVLTRGFREAMLIAAGFSALGGLIAFATIRRSVPVQAAIQPSIVQCCHPPELAKASPAA